MTGLPASPLIIIGAGGHGRVVAALAQRAGHRVRGFLDRGATLIPEGLPVLGGDEYLDSSSAREFAFAIGLGSRTAWERRRSLCDYIDSQGLSAPRLIDPDAAVAPTVQIGHGAQILMGARIQNGASIEEWCIVNTAAVVEHDCFIEGNVHVAPGAILCGGVTVGEGAFIGAGALVKEGLKIGNRSTIGMGAVVVRDVSDGQMVVGVPARGIHVK